MNETHQITTDFINFDHLNKIVNREIKLELSDEAVHNVVECRKFLDNKLEQSNTPIYGINTGFGSLYDRNISEQNLEKLQENLVKSHACGTGDKIPSDVVRLMLFLKIQSMVYGHSGVQIETVERLVSFYNQDIYPIIYEFGSLGASGDLAPLAHLALPLIGEGEVYHLGKILTGEEINRKFNWKPIHFKPKEGLALLNGTQFMSAFGICNLIHADKLIRLANIIGSISLDAFDGRIEPFEPIVHKIRPQLGQGIVAKRIFGLLSGSEMMAREKSHVQDPYSFRCIPQVHGASLDTIEFVKSIFTAEINGVTDNPNIFPSEDRIISAGNFHGQPLALGMDYLCIALSELGNISERRTFQLISGARELPNYLIANPGINSGLMIPQYTAASLVSKNKELCIPSSSDSIVSSNGQEDHVSMGANAAVKASKVVGNLYSILAIELLTACQAFEFRRPAKTSTYLETLIGNFRKVVPFIENDRILYHDIKNAEEFLKKLVI